MENRITVRMPQDLLERLDHEAVALGRNRSEVIRMAVERFLEGHHERTEGRPVDRVRDLLGSFESGIPDLGQRHREHLVERLHGTRPFQVLP